MLGSISFPFFLSRVFQTLLNTRKKMALQSTVSKLLENIYLAPVLHFLVGYIGVIKFYQSGVPGWLSR